MQTSSPKVFTGCLDACAAGTTQAKRCTNHACASLQRQRGRGSERSEERAGTVRSNRGRCGRRWRGGGGDRRHGRSRCRRCGTERSEIASPRLPEGRGPVRRGRRQLQKRWARLVRGSGAGRLVASRPKGDSRRRRTQLNDGNRGVPADSITTGRVGGHGLRRAVGA